MISTREDNEDNGEEAIENFVEKPKNTVISTRNIVPYDKAIGPDAVDLALEKIKPKEPEKKEETEKPKSVKTKKAG